MNKPINLLVAFILLAYCGTAQTTFQKYIDRDFGSANSINEVGHAVQQTADGGYIVAGSSDNYGIGLEDMFVVRLNSNGDTLWTKLYGNAFGNDLARDVVVTSDGGFALAGETQSGAGNIDAVIVKIDSVGNLMWSKAFGGSGADLGHGIIEMNGGDLVLAGESYSFGLGANEAFIVRVDATGNTIWAKTLGANDNIKIRGISPTSSGGFILSGEESVASFGVFMANFDSNGDTLWCRGYRSQFSAYEGYDCAQTSDGGYIMAANYFGGSIGGKDMVLLKVSSTGSVSWVTEIGTINTDLATNVLETSDGGYIASGTATIGVYAELVMAKVNSSGNLQWSKRYMSEFGTYYSLEQRFEAIETADNGLAVVGSIYNNYGNTLNSLYNGYDIVLIKGDSNGGGFIQGCSIDANLQSAPATWAEWGVPCTLSTISPTITNSVFTEMSSYGNTGDVGVKLNFITTPVSCGICDGSVMANPCDSSGFYCSGKNPYSYAWSDGMNQITQTATGLCSGVYIVTVTDFLGCTGVDTASVSSAAVSQEICLVTVDSTATKNVVVWEKPVTTTIDSFRIYRDIIGVYTHIGSVAYADLSEFVDITNNINPQTTSYRYKISTIDTCGNESSLSTYHETIHLTINGSNLIWDNYEGFPFLYYRILRDTIGLGDFVKIDSVTNNNFTFTDPSPSLSYNNYKIEVVHSDGCTAGKIKNYNSSKSNTSFAIGTGIYAENNKADPSTLLIYPNPLSDFTKITFKTSTNGLVQFNVYDMMGKKVWSYKDFIIAGSKSIIWKSEVPSGLYIIDCWIVDQRIKNKILKLK